MPLSRKRSLGSKSNLKNAFLFFLAASLLTVALPESSAASKQPPKKPEQTYVQQIMAEKNEEPLDAENIYKIVPPKKPLLSSTQFKVIDDFNTGELKSRLGAAWVVDKDQEKKIRLALKKEDARGFQSGASLLVRVNLKRNDQATFRTSLEKLDISAAHYLVLKCKSQASTPFTGRLRVALTDWAGKTVEQDITDACLETESWGEAILPISIFTGVDLNQLSSLSFTIQASDRNLAGKLGLDEVAFFGYPEVGFESVEDNLVGFPRVVMDAPRRAELLATKNDQELLLKIAQDTWKYFSNIADKRTHLVTDHIKVGDFPLAAAYTSPTNIAMDLMATVAARELGIITPGEAEQRVQNVLRTLKKLQTWKGFFFNFYETTQLNVSRQFVSSVDNGWLAIALVVVRQAFPGEIAKEATALLDRFHFQEFLDPDNNHLAIGYDLNRQSLTPYHYGMLVTEARAMSLYGIGKGDLPEEHWWYLFRTAPEAWEWQTQKPQGKMVDRGKVNYFQGYYCNCY